MFHAYFVFDDTYTNFGFTMYRNRDKIFSWCGVQFNLATIEALEKILNIYKISEMLFTDACSVSNYAELSINSTVIKLITLKDKYKLKEGFSVYFGAEKSLRQRVEFLEFLDVKLGEIV